MENIERIENLPTRDKKSLGATAREFGTSRPFCGCCSVPGLHSTFRRNEGRKKSLRDHRKGRKVRGF